MKIEDFNPNILDKYTQYSYYFRLFMVDEPNALSKTVPGPDQIPEENIIAETGGASSNACSIEDVSMTSYGGIDKESGLGVSTDFNIQIIQSLGGTLLDDIYKNAKRLGIKNVARIPFFLELTFRVRDPDTQQPLGWQRLGDYRWVWPLILYETRMDISSSGSMYNFKAAFFDSIGLYKETADLVQNVVIAAETVGEFFDELSKVLTSPDGDTEKNVYESGDVYKFITSKLEQPGYKLMEDWKLKQTDKKDGFENQRSDSFERKSEGEREKPTFAFSAGTSIDSIVYEILTGTKFFQVELAANSNVEQSNEPKATQDPSKKFKQLFRVVQTVNLLSFNKVTKDYNKELIYEIEFYGASTYVSSPSDPEIIRTSLDDYTSRGVLKKAYNYNFTGLNDDVIDFDLKFNFNWYLALPIQASEFMKNSHGDLGEKDDLEREDKPTDTLTKETTKEENETPMAGGVVGSQFMTNTNSLDSTGRNLISMLFEQIMSPTSGDMINVDIDIKGDPFWLEPDPLPTAGKAPDYRERATRIPTDTSNNSTGRQTFFVFTTYIPEQYDANTGLVPAPSPSNIINGIYSVRKAVHKFSKGKFTQTLTAVRDPHLNINSILSDNQVVSRSGGDT